MKNRIKRLLLILVVLAAGSQLIRPTKTNPPIDPQREIHANLPLDSAASGVLSRACNDCHSNRTVWPWYSHVAPSSWLVVSDVNRGRKAMNLSEWSAYSAEAQQKHLAEMCKEVTEGEMPGLPYTLLHPEARLSSADRAALCNLPNAAGPKSAVAEVE
ncbi:MAG TPA: heme-binding domain-containing protein [Candidatus Acidoferrum sp.]|nr:heme-binding domain-containing protein [Candidatus Acidoferrum sp.]